MTKDKYDFLKPATYLLLALGLSSFGGAVAATDITTPTIDAWRADPVTPITAAQINLDDFQWQARPVVIVADDTNDSKLAQQLDIFSKAQSDVIARDMVIVTDTTANQSSALRQQLGHKQGFGVCLIGKDGRVKLSSKTLVSMQTFIETIDVMPMRLQEMRDQ